MKFYLTMTSGNLKQYLYDNPELLLEYRIALDVETGNSYYKHVIILNSLEELIALNKCLGEEIVINTDHFTNNTSDIAGRIEIYNGYRE